MPTPEEDPVHSHDTDAPDSRPAPRWFERVLPMTALGVAVVGLAALLIPGLGDQAALSASRQPQPYVELYFAHSAAANGQAVCTAKGSKAYVRFVVGSHLEKRQAVAYRVVLTPVSKGVKAARAVGSVRVTPGTQAAVTKTFARPRGAYTVSVRLPALDQQLRAHCPGRRS